MTNINYIQLVDPINSPPLAEEQSRRWPENQSSLGAIVWF
ncbi:hypothetical protein MICCA_3110009 [Microcystis aeruginosa PCC 9432]|jgi:hypothetical protein|uniref:Uncharacterized protein n=1 Tax=Microcystis aeruginosa PCC 9432 TaxID=1160280 RepID=A0A822LDF3_MICAE|nr:hypothetical protein MICCA_3110009 [Microcystis aeruginosa PCC 9432]